ncbi:MAG: hypothetical protein JWR80_4075 [Bradyrhizobium sp.]|nr:hypothetical protein [Bradyrhizobium sp.]
MERWRRALDIAGLVPASSIAIKEVWDAEATRISLDIMFNPQPAARLEFDVIEGLDGIDQVEALHFNTCEFSGRAISFAVRAHLYRAPGLSKAFASTRFELLDARPSVVDLQAYGAELADANDLSIVIDPRNVIMPSKAEKKAEIG